MKDFRHLSGFRFRLPFDDYTAAVVKTPDRLRARYSCLLDAWNRSDFLLEYSEKRSPRIFSRVPGTLRTKLSGDQPVHFPTRVQICEFSETTQKETGASEQH